MHAHANPDDLPGDAAQTTTLKCSYCGKTYVLNQSAHRPFCGVLCQQLDLRNWLTESYGLPYEGGPERQLTEPDDEFDES